MTKEVSMLGKLIIKDGKTGLAAPLVSKLSDDVKTCLLYTSDAADEE